MMFDAHEHEPLTTMRFDTSPARAFVRDVIRTADAAFDPARGWPLHPEDRYGRETISPAGVYNGAAGTIWALTTLATSYDFELQDEYATTHGRRRVDVSRAQRFAAHAMEQVAAWRATFGMPSFSLRTGELGVALYIDAVLRRDPRVLTLDSL